MEERLQRKVSVSVMALFLFFCLVFFFLITRSLLHSALLFPQFLKQPWLLLLCLSSFPFPFSTYSMEFSMIIAAHLLVNFFFFLLVNSDSRCLILDRKKERVY